MAAPAKPKGNSTWNTIEPFAFGGLSGMFATCCIQPIDMVKVRIQLQGEGGKGAAESKNPFSVMRNIVKNEGVGKLYAGLSAALLRQATYTTARLGLFRTISNSMQQGKEPLPFWKKSVAGLLAGGIGCIFGTPADVALIRMQADGKLPPEQRRNYKHVGDALARMLREEGVSGLFRGNVPVIIRASMLNLGMLATYDQALESLKTVTSNDLVVSGGAKLISGFAASAFSLPFDFVKTRIQKQVKKPDGTMPYRSFMHCALTVTKEEGPMAFYRGFWTYYARIAPHAMITLWAMEQLVAFKKSVID
jgi:solute carrier family 25 oxoglutarate transporter 11